MPRGERSLSGDRSYTCCRHVGLVPAPLLAKKNNASQCNATTVFLKTFYLSFIRLHNTASETDRADVFTSSVKGSVVLSKTVRQLHTGSSHCSLLFRKYFA
ncbi:hypothetical protein F2P81_024995 [Scophthalmus maximus]|uniref:Uncharacterized protein n=1 Tax=Scophthalmus maximus TaxID=52904 RepID=A0A6A4RX33_SCOMX|nr:hypothetical protein F2P81_024995 [Scophthalmus maximus]